MLSASDLAEDQRGTDRRWPDSILTATFYLTFLLQLSHHNLWRDELNAFGLVQASPTLGSLFSHIRYEGHPWLWYLLLWVVSCLTTSALSIKFLEACIIAASYSLLGLRSPFSRTEKVLLFCSYFVSFEYAVLSRMYSLLLLLLLLYLWQRTEHPKRIVSNCFLLGLLSSTDIMGLILSMGLLVEYASSIQLGFIRATPKHHFLTGAGIYAAMTAVAMRSAQPAADIGWRTTGHPFDHVHDGGHFVLSAVSYVVMPLLPIGFGPFAPSFWNPVAALHLELYLVCLPLAFITYYLIFQFRKPLLLLLGVTILSAVSFGHVIYLGAMRHWGVTFLAFFAALWLMKRKGESLPKLAFLLLGLNAVCGTYAGYAQWQRPFSNAQPVAAWLSAHRLKDAPIAGTPDTTVASVAVLLHRPIYMLDCNCIDSFVLFSNRRDSYNRVQIPNRIMSAPHILGSADFIYMDAYPLSQAMRGTLVSRGFQVEDLVSFTGATFMEEDFFLYRVRSSAPAFP